MNKLHQQVAVIEARSKGNQFQACEHGNPVCLLTMRVFLAANISDMELRRSVCYVHFLEIEADTNYDLLAGVA